MSDGAHMAREDWQPALASLRDKSWKFAPEVVAFGFDEADQDTIRKIATLWVPEIVSPAPGLGFLHLD